MTPSTSILAGGKRCLKVLRTLTSLKRKLAAAVLHEKPESVVRPDRLSQCPFHLSVASLERTDSRSTIMTWLDESAGAQEVADNRRNEWTERTRKKP